MNTHSDFVITPSNPLHFGPTLPNGPCGFSCRSINAPVEEHHDEHGRVKRSHG